MIEQDEIAKAKQEYLFYLDTKLEMAFNDKKETSAPQTIAIAREVAHKSASRTWDFVVAYLQAKELQ